MTIPNLPPFYLPGYPVQPLPDVVPFTSRSGATFAEVFYQYRDYIDNTVIPAVNTNQETLVAALNEIAEGVLESGVEVSAPIMAQIAADENSVFSVILAGLFAGKEIEDVVDAAVISISNINTDLTTVKGDVANLKTLTETGRLSDAKISQKISDGVTTTVPGAVSGIVQGSLKKSKAKLNNSPSTFKLAFVGDSTTFGATDLFSTLRDVYTKSGMIFDGVPSANIIQGGNNGWTLEAWLSDFKSNANTAPYSLASLISANPDAIVFSFGINDCRQGATTQAQLKARLEEARTIIANSLPNADIIFRMPNSLTKTVVGQSYVSGITHQAVSTIMRDAYLEMENRWPNVVVADMQADVFGTVAMASNVLMYDELHPTPTGYRAIAHKIASMYGPENSLAPNEGYRYVKKGIIAAAGNGYMYLDVVPGKLRGQERGKEWPLSPTDILVVSGYGDISLSGTTFTQNGNNLNVLKTGDWSALAGAPVTVIGTHGGVGIDEGRIFATIDLPNVPPGAYVDTTFTIAGITRENGVVVQPPSSVWATGLILSYGVSNTDTITIRAYNPTAAAIDLASSAGWRIWVVR